MRAASLGRLRLEGETTKADVVVGLDMNLVAEAKSARPLRAAWRGCEGSVTSDRLERRHLHPLRLGLLAFVYDANKLANPPKSLKELVDNPNGPKVVLQDPRTSAPGLGLLLWMRKVYGDKAGEAWGKLKPRIVTFTKGWSEAYGLFLKGEADMVLSYTTSPAYHVVAEKKDNYKAAAFTEGHYLHVELAGMTRTTKQPELPGNSGLHPQSEPFQSAMPEGNWMMPAKTPAAGLPAAFKDLVQPSQALLFTPEEVQQNRRAFTDAWLNATAR